MTNQKLATINNNPLINDFKTRTSKDCKVDIEKNELITVVTQKDSTSISSTVSVTSEVLDRLHWVYTFLKSPSLLWYFACQITIFGCGVFSKFVLKFMNKSKVYNREPLVEAISKREKGVPLITVANHYSGFDDPGIWSILPFRFICNSYTIRWCVAAYDICFANFFHSLFFMSGKCIPVVRGMGVYQEGIDLCIQKCALGQWVHIFPEGKINRTKEDIRIKWGVARIIYESPRVPIVIPIFHIGMERVFPNEPPFGFKWRQKVTFNVGKPLDLNDFIQDLKDRLVPETEARKLIIDKIQAAFHDLRLETQLLHEKN